MLEYGKPIGFRNRFPPLLAKRIVVPEASIRALFSTPFVLFPATSGIGFVIERGILYKEAGTAYTIGGAGNYSITHSGALGLLGANPPAGVFDQAGAITVLMQGEGQSGIYPNINLTSQVIGLNIQLQQAAANMTGGSGNLICYFEFRAYTNGPFMWD